jgi:hypothetical protein
MTFPRDNMIYRDRNFPLEDEKLVELKYSFMVFDSTSKG